MSEFQVTFKGERFDVTVSAKSATEAAEKYKRLSEELNKALGQASTKSQSKSVAVKPQGRRPSAKGTQSKLEELVDEGFFKTGKQLKETQEELAKKGITKPVTHIAPYLTEFVRNNILEREQVAVGNRKVWVYKEKPRT
ncbi:hypothetical protein AUI06_10145 [archaeon 13_2_20CM_2_52_21]|nr:MAG: hypothetical protein AUI06_10145 [archaeon 13_2_20CM_2_52_21]